MVRYAWEHLTKWLVRGPKRGTERARIGARKGNEKGSDRDDKGARHLDVEPPPAAQETGVQLDTPNV